MHPPITRFVCYLLLLSFLVTTTLGQTAAPPSTDIFLVEMTGRNAEVKVGEPVNVTKRDGYDNQPMFLPDGRSLLYTSIREDRQADIYQYDIEKKSTTRITATKEAEYSPTPTPDGKFMSVVRVEADSSQRLWKFPLGGGEPSLVLEAIKPVGYHAWVDENTVALFVLGSPATLQLADVRTGKAEVIVENIGRTLLRVPRQDKVSFVHRVSENELIIKAFDVKTRQITSLISTLPGSEYYAWTPDGVLLMGQGAKLFKCEPGKDVEWQEFADFSKFGVKQITRLAVSAKGDRLALVAQP
jgi:hypothetical protein